MKATQMNCSGIELNARVKLIKSRLSLIVQVNLVLNRTVVVDSVHLFTPGFKPFTKLIKVVSAG